MAGAAAPLAVLLVTVPRYLDLIGEVRYGVLAVVWVVLGYFGVFDLGLGRATANRIASMSEAAPDDRARVVWTALLVNLAFGALGALVLLVVAYLVVALTVPGNLRAEALAGLPWLAAAVPLMTTSSVIRGVLEGRERFVAVNAFGIASTSLFQIVPLAVAYWRGPNLAWLVAGAAAATLAGTAFGLLLCRNELSVALPPRFVRAHVGPLFRYGGWVMVTGVVGPLLHAVDRVVIAGVAGTRAVTHYTVPFSLVARAEIVPASLARTLFPRFTMLDDAGARVLGRDALRSLIAVLTPLVVVGLVVVEPFLVLWVGPDLASAGAPVAAIILVGLWLNGLAYIPFTLLQARGRPDVPAKFHVVELPLYLGALWAGLAVAGIEGAACAWTLRAGLDAALLVRASRIEWRDGTGIAAAAGAVAVAAAGALVIFSEPLLRASLGAAVVVFALVAACRAAPEPLWAIVRGLPGVRVVLRSPA